MEGPIKKVDGVRITPDVKPIIDVSYVELPEKLTYKVNLSGVLGTVAFLAVLLVPGFVEENPIGCLLMVAVFAVCIYLALKEDGKLR